MIRPQTVTREKQTPAAGFLVCNTQFYEALQLLLAAAPFLSSPAVMKLNLFLLQCCNVLKSE